MEAEPEPGITPILLQSYAQAQEGGWIGIALLILVLLFFSALISGSEVAYFSLHGEVLSELKQEGSKRANRIIALLKRPKYLLATILIANNVINIAIVILSSVLSARYLLMENELLAFLIQIVLITFLLVLFGEVTPKIYAQTHYLKLASLMALPMNLLVRVLSPLQCFW